MVDDAIVVIENITRYLEQGMAPLEAALEGAAEIGFTVVSISISLIAVFIPILLMGGIVGRLFREFAVTLSAADLRLDGGLADHHADDVRAAAQAARRGDARPAVPRQRAGLQRDARRYDEHPAWVLRHQPLTLTVALLATLALSIYLFAVVPEGILPAAGHRPPDRARSRPIRTPRSRRCTTVLLQLVDVDR